MAIENLLAGSLIIPMDVTYQNKGMLLAYGLVYRLLDNGIPVKWAIKDNKVYGATDFSATTRDYTIPAEIPSSKSYAGGPFIVPAANAAAAQPIIDAYQAANLAQFPASGRQPVVHLATAAFNADIAFTLSRAPRIAVEDTNNAIIRNYLNTAKIPDSNGNTWTAASPGVLTETELDNGALFGIDRSQVPPPSEVCIKKAYDVFLSPHTSDGTWQGSAAADDMVDFLFHGGFLHATCHSMSALENFDVGPILLTSKNQTDFNDNKGDTSTFTVDLPDYPTAQAVPRGPAATQGLPGGSEQTWLHTDVTYNPNVYVLAHFLDNSTQYDFMAGGAFRGVGAGVAVYEGGHEYKDIDKVITNGYSTVEDAVYTRFVLNTIFFSVGKPYLEMLVFPQNVSATATTPVTFTLINTGGAPAVFTSPFVVTLAPFVDYTPGTAVPLPDSEVLMAGQWVLTWNIGSLPGGPGTLATIPAVIDPSNVGGTIPNGENSAINYQGSWIDAYNQPASINFCTSINALPGAAPNIQKLPLNQSVSPNGLATWSINVSNNGTVAISSAFGPPPFVITETLPAGWVVDPGTTTPWSSIGPGPGGTTIITWQCPGPGCPPMLDPLLPGGSFTLNLGAFAPSATTATYNNNVNLTGTDGTTTFNINAQAQVNVVNSPPTVTVDNPLEGDISCNGVNIQWTASDPDGDTPLEISLFYSSNGAGGPFTQITTIPDPLLDPPTNSFFWDTTALPSGNNYVVLVVASDGELVGEAFSGVFTVDNTPPTVNWVSPTNGATLSTTPFTLQAAATDNVSVTDVEFFYSTDGITFTSIGVDASPGPGNIYSTNWELTGLPQGSYILRATATDGCGDTTDADITVTVNLPPEVTLINPNGGEIICPQGTTITWTAEDPSGDTLTFKLEYSSNGGVTYNLIADGIPGPCTPNCNYAWDTSGLPSGNNYLVRVTASDGLTETTDVSDAPFTIDNTPPVVNWVSPTNGALLTTSPVTLQATATDNVGVANVTFQYSADGITYTNIGTDTTPGPGNIYSVSWNFGALPGGDYKLKAIATDTPCNQTSEAIIDVTANLPPTVTLLSPNGGEIICPQGTDIVWTASDPQGDPLLFKLEYSANGGATYNLIADGISGPCTPNCSYAWDTSALPSGSNYVVRVTASDGISEASDVSDAPFTIDNSPPVVNWVSPTNGALITTSPVTLQASATDNVGVTGVTFEYSNDGGLTYNLIGTDNVPSGNIYSVNWNFAMLPAGSYRLRATAADACQQTSSAIINVTADLPPTVDLISPNGGETVCKPGTTINWVASDANGDPLTYSLLYSSNGGVSYSLIVTGLPGSCPPPGPPFCSYVWNTSALTSGNNYLIKIVATDGILTAEDVSDAPFTIDNTPPTLTVLTPLEGEFLVGTKTLSAIATDNVSVTGVTFEYSQDGGTTFNLIGTVNVPFDSTYAIPWDTTTVSDGPKIIRVTAADQCNNTSEQRRNVTVDNTPPTVEIPSPPNGSTVNGTVPILVTGEDNECLAKVELYIDGILVQTVTVPGGGTTADFIFDWDTTEFAEGPHVVKAVATDCAGLVAETTNTYIVDNLPEHYQQLLVDGNLTIPPQKPDVEQIIDFEVVPEVAKISIFPTIDGTKVTVRGYVEIGVTYSTDGPQEEHYAEFKVPFNAMILFPDLPLDAKVEPVIFIEHKQWHLLDPRTIKKDIVLFVGIRQLIC